MEVQLKKASFEVCSFNGIAKDTGYSAFSKGKRSIPVANM